MGDAFRGTVTPRRMLNLIDHLPRNSAYVEAVAQDDDAAELAPDAPASHQVHLSEWSPEVEALAVVADRLGEVINAVLVNHPSGKGKPARIPAYPRPVTAFDRVRARRRREAAIDLERKLFPDLH